MFKTIRKTASAFALSASLGLAAVAVPAPAQANDDVANIIAGLAALFIIGAAIEQHNDRDDRARATAQQTRPQQTRPQQQARPNRQADRVAPARCFRETGGVRGYSRRCMQNHAARPELLPRGCLVQVNTDRGPRTLYAGRCLRQNGWVREAGFRP